MAVDGRTDKEIADETAALLAKAKVALQAMKDDALEKAKKGGFLGQFFNRQPGGTPKGGQFAPKGQGGGGSAQHAKPPVAKITVTGMDKPAAKKQAFDALFPGKKPAWASGEGEAGQYVPGSKKGSGAPEKPPAGAVKHAQKGEDGKAVHIHKPDTASPDEAWGDKTKTVTVTPGGKTPAELNGVAFSAWKEAPTTKDGWAGVAGQNPALEDGLPFLTSPQGKSVGAGVIVQEPDGRVWLTSPTNAYGGYKNTFPKGTAEDGIPSLQANAIKEAYEETGLQVKITGVLGDFERTTSVARFYLAERVGGTPAAMGWESQAVKLVPAKDLFDQLNHFADDKVVAAMEFELGFTAKPRPWKPKPDSFSKSAWKKQPRWPGGTPIGGQWKAYDGDGMTLPPTNIGSAANPGHTKKAANAYTAAKAGDKGKLQAILDNTSGAAITWSGTGGKGLGFHVKEAAKVHQYALELKNQLDAAAGAKATATKLTGTPNIKDWTKVGAKPGGTNPGGIYTDDIGTKWLVKGNLKGEDEDRARNEVLASELMKAAGIPAPNIKLVDLNGQYGGGKGVAVEWMEGLKAFGKADVPDIQKQFAVQAWLANYDVIGLSNDNMMKSKAGNLINIDPGGALLYRAQGAKKTDFGPNATEFDSMRKQVAGVPINNAAHAVFGSMTGSQLAESAMLLKGVSDDMIVKLVQAHGPGDATDKQILAAKLIARRDDILERAGLSKIKVAAPVGSVKPDKLAVTVPPPAVSSFYHGAVNAANIAFKGGDARGLAKLSEQWADSESKDGQAVSQYVTALQQSLNTQLDAASKVTDSKGTEFNVSDGVATPANGKGVVAMPPPPTFDGPKAGFYEKNIVAKIDGFLAAKDLSGLLAFGAGSPAPFPAQTANGMKAGMYFDDAVKALGGKETYDKLYFNTKEANAAIVAGGSSPAAKWPKGHDGATADAKAAMLGVGKPEFGLPVNIAAAHNVLDILNGFKTGTMSASEAKAALDEAVQPYPGVSEWATNSAIQAGLGAPVAPATAPVAATAPVKPTPPPSLTPLYAKVISDQINIGGESALMHLTVRKLAAEKFVKNNPDGEYKAVLQYASAGAEYVAKTSAPTITMKDMFEGGYPKAHNVLKAADLYDAYSNMPNTKTEANIGVMTPVMAAVVHKLNGEEVPTSVMMGLKMAASKSTQAGMNGKIGKWAMMVQDKLDSVKPITGPSITGMAQGRVAKPAAAPTTAAPQPTPAAPPSMPIPPQPKAPPVTVDPFKATIDPKAASLPNFDGAKIPPSNSNSASHNAKVETIAMYAKVGNVKAILSLNYGTNTYGKKQAQLANDTLAALGSPHKVDIGQKTGAHPALVGNQPVAQPTPGEVPPPKVTITAVDLPPKPQGSGAPGDFVNWNGPGAGLSSKATINVQNTQGIAAIEEKALQGDLAGLKALTFDQLDAAGAATGKQLSYDTHPSKHVQGYFADSINAVHDKLYPVETPTSTNVVTAQSIQHVADHFAPKPLFTNVEKLHKAEQFGFWAVLGQVTNPQALAPKDPKDFSPATIEKGKQVYKSMSSLGKKFVSSIQSSGAINNAYRSGKKEFNGLNLTDVNEAIHKEAMDLDEGRSIYRWQNMTPSMVMALKKSKPGAVIQATGPMCTSYSSNATQGFGQHRIVIRSAAGAKGVPSYASGQFGGEYEVSTLPMSRFVLLGVKEVPGKGGKTRLEVELLMLPPPPKKQWGIFS